MPDDSGTWLVIDLATDIDRTTDGRGRADRRGVSLVRVVGEIDLGTRASFEAGLEQVLADDPRGIVVDACAMAFCGAGGLAALMNIVARGAERETDVVVVGFSPMLLRLCAKFWPGPQPTPFARVSDAVRSLPVDRMSMAAPAIEDRP